MGMGNKLAVVLMMATMTVTAAAVPVMVESTWDQAAGYYCTRRIEPIRWRCLQEDLTKPNPECCMSLLGVCNTDCWCSSQFSDVVRSLQIDYDLAMALPSRCNLRYVRPRCADYTYV